ncbi:MAG TPA: hypothetical protein VFX76_21160, partial [Roseiflexaceae bacterium]|nr:hypothetical protein [Roseiflexaceae bacterium]
KDVQIDVTSLLRGRDGTLWVGLESDGILRQDSNGWVHFGAAQGVGNSSIIHMLEGQDGTLWAAASESGLLRFDSQQGNWQRVPVGRDDQWIYGIAEIDGKLYASGSPLVAQSEDNGANWTALATSDYSLGSFIHLFVRDTSGHIWIGSDQGVSTFANGQWRRVQADGDLPMSGVGALTLGPDGKLWAIEQYGGTAASIDPATLAVEPVDSRGARINAVAFTKDTAWYGTTDGVARQRGGALTLITTADGLPSNTIRQLLATDTTLWIGTDKGLAMYDLAGSKIAGTVPELDGGIVEVLYQAPNGDVWAGSQRVNGEGKVALGRFSDNTWQVWEQGSQPLATESAGVTAIHADAQEHIWVGVWNGGLHTWDGAAWKSWTETQGAPSGNVTSISLQDSALWMAGFDGNLRGAVFR